MFNKFQFVLVKLKLTFAISSNMCMLLGNRCKSSVKSSRPPTNQTKKEGKEDEDIMQSDRENITSKSFHGIEYAEMWVKNIYYQERASCDEVWNFTII